MAKSRRNQTFAEMLEQIIDDQPSDERLENSIEERKYYLIVCEGEKTEPNYFQSFQKHLPPKIQTIEIVGEGKNTIDVVNKAIELNLDRTNNKSLPNFDEVWAVYDRDGFPNERVNAAFELAKANNVKNGFSNEAFELWYVLHFQFMDTPNTRHQYIEMLNKILLDKKGEKYTKNSEDIYDFLEKHGHQELAIRYAERLCNQFKYTDPSNSKPSTSIYHLVQSLNEYFKK